MHKFTSAVILAAGSGTRFGSDAPKQFVKVNGVPSVVRCIRAFSACELIDEIVLVGDADALRDCIAPFAPDGKPITVVAGGDTRQESALCGFDAISPKAKYVAIHDAARCLVTPEIVEATVRAAYRHRAAVAAEKTVDTVKVADRDGFICDTPERDCIWLVKTPQVFLCDIYRVAAYTAKKESVTATDDSALCERIGFRVKLVECGAENLKLTHPEDLRRAEAILKMREERK